MQNGERIKSKEAASYIGISYSKLTKLRSYGGGPRYIKIGERVLYDKAEIDKWISENSRERTAQSEVLQ